MPQSNQATMERSSSLDPLTIQKTLDDLWREFRAQEGGPLAARARLANLISYCGSDKEAADAANAVVQLSAIRPVRSIIVNAAPSSAAPDACAAIKCDIAGGTSVCYEEITLCTPGEVSRTLPSLLESVTVSDLPVYLWFAGDPPLDEPGIERLLVVADRAVTDSHTFRDPLGRFSRLAALASQLTRKCVFTDMTWTRLGTWREAVGKIFDPVPSREFLPKIREVAITSASGEGTPSDRTIVMTGWLAARLGWKPVSLISGTPWRAEFDGPEGRVTVTWSEGPAAARGNLLGIEMNAGEVEFRVRRVHDDPSGAIRSSIICTGDEQPGPAYHPLHWATHELLCNALEIRTPFEDWEDALACVAALASKM